MWQGPMRLGFLASHGGSNMRAIIAGCRDGRLGAESALIISNNRQSGALQWAAAESLPFAHISARTHADAAELDQAIADALGAAGVNLVVLAGYMKMLGPATLNRYHARILNIHPALLPKHGGRGMYGRRVHEAVLAAGERVTGVTVHLVDEHYDHGPILAQQEVPVAAGDDAESLAKRVLAVEHDFYWRTIERIRSGAIDLDAAMPVP